MWRVALSRWEQGSGRQHGRLCEAVSVRSSRDSRNEVDAGTWTGDGVCSCGSLREREHLNE